MAIKDFKQPLSVIFLWHPENHKDIHASIEYCFKMLKRDSDRPFSRSLNLPVFFCTSDNKSIPSPIKITSNTTMVFAFIGTQVVADKDWFNYIQQLEDSEKYHVIPVALDSNAFYFNGSLRSKNFIRSFEYDKHLFKELLLIALSHEIYRVVFNENHKKDSIGTESRIELFLSHAKDGKQGVTIAEALKTFIDNSSMSNFFDATDIATAYKFNDEIESHIKKSTLIAIHSDPYSSRYWCQKEIQCAKDSCRPIIAVDCLEEFEDRRFPFSSNIPGVHVHLEKGEHVKTEDLLRIIIAALSETIRFFHSRVLLEEYQKSNWFDKSCIILPRPPEVSDLGNLTRRTFFFGKLAVSSKKNLSFAYPEPPVYDDELQIFNTLGINAFTPIKPPNSNAKDFNIGISISELSEYELTKIGQSPAHLEFLIQDISRHLLARKNKLIFGGDLRPNGFTDFLFHEASALQSRLNSEDIFVENYLAWPIYLRDDVNIAAWKAKYNQLSEMKEVPPPDEVLNLIPDLKSYLAPHDVERKYVWAKSLTLMRYTMIANCDARICAGGKQNGYLGRMPGVLEEIIIAKTLTRPIFLLGGFGGMTQTVCNLIETGSIPKQLTKDWQIANNLGYSELLDYLETNDKEFAPHWNDINSLLTIKDLNNGLSKKENLILFSTPFVDEAIHLVLKGLGTIYSRKSV